MPIPRAPGSEDWLPAAKAGQLLGMSPRHVRRLCRDGTFVSELRQGNGGAQYCVALSSLSEAAQAAYRQDAEQHQARVEAIVGEPPCEHSQGDHVALPPEQWRALQERFEALPSTLRDEARLRDRALQRLALLTDSGMQRMQAIGVVADDFGMHANTVRAWAKRVRGQPRADWYLFLAPEYAVVGASKAACPPEAWSYICKQWLVQSKPTLTAVYRRCEREAKRQGWGALPSLKTIKRRIDDEVPRKVVILMREGQKALERIYPAAHRDYSTLGVHAMWESDGHRADLWARFPDGEVRRPIVMAWRDVRTRKVLGFAVSKTENEPLVRESLANAIRCSGAVPTEVLLDNGRAFASKGISGGQPNRYRFTVRDDEVNGALTSLGVHVVWATPGHGQAKPIESWWRTVTETTKRPEFTGAHCGNKPDTRPEECEPAKAVPIENFLRALAEDIDAYQDRPHRGNSMEGKSPNQLYAELMANAIVRTPTAEQLRLCLLGAETVTLHAEDRSVIVMGNRYWSEPLAALKRRGPYTVRFDTKDAAAPVAIYDGDQFLCEATLQARIGFRDQEAGRAHVRARKASAKAAKIQAKALLDQAHAASWVTGQSPTPASPQAGQPVNSPAVPQLVQPLRRNPRPVAVDAEPDDLADFRAMVNKTAQRQREESEPKFMPRRSASG